MDNYLLFLLLREVFPVMKNIVTKNERPFLKDLLQLH